MKVPHAIPATINWQLVRYSLYFIGLPAAYFAAVKREPLLITR